jgi:hypothetical protein
MSLAAAVEVGASTEAEDALEVSKHLTVAWDLFPDELRKSLI